MPQVPVEKLNRRAPEYQLYSDAWESFELLASGGVRLKQAAFRFLIRAPRELYDVYSERVRAMTYQNILGTVMGWYTSQLWKRNPQINVRPDGADPWYADFLENCDRAGNSYNDFHRVTFRNLALYGRAWTLTDKPRALAMPESRADEKEQGLDAPYIINYLPQEVINWSLDEKGELEWAVIKTIHDDRVFLEGQGTRIRWYYFDRTEYRVYEFAGQEKAKPLKNDDGFTYAQAIRLVDSTGRDIQQEEAFADLVSEGEHALASIKRCPLRRFVLPEELWLANRAFLQLVDHINQDNSLKWGLFMGNVPMPIVFSDGDIAPLTISQSGFLKFGSNDKFEWAAPPHESYALSQQRLNFLREEIYRSFYLQAQGRSSSASASAQSGYSKEVDMMPANEILNGFGDRMISAMQDVFGDVVAARGGDVKAVTLDVSGFRFETKPVTESVGAAQEMLDLGIFDSSPTLERESFKRVASDYLEDRNEQVKQQVFDEIEKSPTTSERAQQQQDQAVDAQQKAFSTSFDRLAAREQAHTELEAA